MARPSPSRVADPTASITARVCPYLLAEDGGWRASTATREHRCTAVAPPAILATDKQRRLCLTADHLVCATYLAAGAAGAPVPTEVGGDGAHLAVDGVAATERIRPAWRSSARTVVRTAPVVLDHGRVAVAMPALRGGARWGQASLVALMVVAFAAILFARLPVLGPARGETGSPRSSAVATRAPGATDGAGGVAVPTGEPVATVGPVRTLVPTGSKPTARPAPSSAASSAKPAASQGTPSTYKIKRGDTLSGIAARFGTTWQVLAQLNGIKDPGRLRVGQVLQLP